MTYRLLDLLYGFREHNSCRNLSVNVRPSFDKLLEARIVWIGQNLEVSASVTLKLAKNMRLEFR